MLRHLALTAATLYLAAIPVRAAEKDTVNVTFDVLFWADWPEQNLLYLSGNKEKIIPLQNGLSGGLYKYEGPAGLVFYRELKPDPATGAELPVPLASIRFPKPNGHYILLFCKQSEAKNQYAVFPIPVTPYSFPMESVLAINFSKSEAQLQIQGLRGSLAPKGNRFFEVKCGDFPVQMATRQNDQWQLAYSSMTSMQKKQRLLMVVHDTPQADADVAVFPIQDPASTEETLVDKDYEPEEMPEWRKSGIFR